MTPAVVYAEIAEQRMLELQMTAVNYAEQRIREAAQAGSRSVFLKERGWGMHPPAYIVAATAFMRENGYKVQYMPLYKETEVKW